jgi:hypothetical protein
LEREAASNEKNCATKSGLSKARVLDVKGMKVEEIELPSHATGKSFTFPADALNVVVL